MSWNSPLKLTVCIHLVSIVRAASGILNCQALIRDTPPGSGRNRRMILISTRRGTP
jgi:hypothetical protein